MKDTMKNGRATQRKWRGLTAVAAVLLAFILVAQLIVNGMRTDIDKFLGTKSTILVTEETDAEDLYTYQSDYKTTTELLKAIQAVGEQMNAEGSVLLKNNGALPLTQAETQKISLLGFSSYYPVMGGDMGSSLSVNVGTAADTVDFVQALTAKGFKINGDLQAMYKELEPYFSTEVASWGGTITYTRMTSPAIGGVFSSVEPSQSLMDSTNAGWKNTLNDYNVMIITIARAAGENRDYTPGTAGVNPEQNLNQRDPLGLSDDERDLINAAVAAKAANGGKVIVLLNNASAMEIDEIKNNDGVDAIMQVGLPGGYGFYGVADLLSGAVNPSGHLADTYAVVNANSPAAQNYGNLAWTNGNSEWSMNSAVVEAENIYIGYKYYETRYMDAVMGKGNASAAVGSTDGVAWKYDNEVSYAFGYGLSYTTFSQKLDNLVVDLESKTVTTTVTVTNTGKVAGKDVVQLYVSLPYTDYDKQNGIEKAGVQLLDYAKTGTIAPGASETVTIVADMQNMTTWDSTAANAAGTKGVWMLDAGDYLFTIGNGAHEAANNVLAAQGYTTANGMTADGNKDLVKTWTLSATDTTTFAVSKAGVAVANHLEDMDINYWLPGTAIWLTRNDWQGTWPKTYADLTATATMLDVLDNDNYEIHANGNPASVTFGAKNGLTLADLKGVTDLDDIRWSQLMDQILLEDCMIRTGFGGTSTKAIESIMSPLTIQNDGPNGIYSYPLGQYATTDPNTTDPCKTTADDPNLTYKFGTMCNETVIASTFSKQMARAYGEVVGNYSLWSNLTIYWGCGNNIHRLPYNARNHEYYSEDAVLSAQQGTNFVQGGMKYGCIVAPKHYAFNDTEVNRTGVAVFMTEQQARENELRCTQPIVEDGCLGLMTAFNRAGLYTANAHTGLMIDILRQEWGYKGLISEDFIRGTNYSVLKEAVMNGVTMTCNTGDSTMQAVTEKWSYWTVENVSKDTQLLQALKQAMTWQAYALANSNAMDGMAPSSTLVSVNTWYDYALMAMVALFAVLTAGCAYLYIKSGKKEN